MYVVDAIRATITIVWTGCVVALRERAEKAGVKGSHFGGGFLAVKAGGRKGRCIVVSLPTDATS
jgi:hypothetical protein